MWKQLENGRVVHRYEWIVLAATLAVIPVFLIEAEAKSGRWKDIAYATNWLIWVVFAAELAFILVVAPRKAAALKAHWLDAVIVAVTEQFDVFERRFLVLLEPQAEPAGGEPGVAVRLFPCDQCRQLERLGDGHAADLSCGHLGEYEVVVFQRPPKDRSRMALRGRRCSSPGPRRRSESKAVTRVVGEEDARPQRLDKSRRDCWRPSRLASAPADSSQR
jgi:hypothetical protein